MNFSFLPPKIQDSGAAISCVNSLDTLFSGTAFDAITNTKAVVDAGATAFLTFCLFLPLMVKDWDDIHGLIVYWILSLLMSQYCFAYSNRLHTLLKIYDSGLSFRRSLRHKEAESKILNESD